MVGNQRSWVGPVDQPTDYEQLIELSSRVEQILRELDVWLHMRERVAARAGARLQQQAWRRRRTETLRYSQALLAALLRDLEV